MKTGIMFHICPKLSVNKPSTGIPKTGLFLDIGELLTSSQQKNEVFH